MVDNCEFPFCPALPVWESDDRLIEYARFVGTEEGIFEYSINLTDRKMFPALHLR